MPQAEGNKPANSLLPEITRVLADGVVAVLATLVSDPEGVGTKLLVQASGETSGSLDDRELDIAVANLASDFLSSRQEARTYPVASFAPSLTRWSASRIMLERIEPEPRLVICGAGHVGSALARLARVLGYRVSLIDDREDFVNPERFAGLEIELVAASDWAAAVAQTVGTGRGVSVAVVTRGHSEDEHCMRALMKASPDYVGLIGSKRRTSIVLERLRAAGASDERLQQVRAPIGLDIGAVSPEEVALAILAEIVAERRGGKGAPLSAWRRE
jgi:xanthine dehydrogenase accessory factor